MKYETIFKRNELKYVITAEQKEKLLSRISKYISPDEYGRTTVRNLYFDTDNYRLIRRSIDKPAYKEKIRVRSYSRADNESNVFVELKKKYDSVVTKRRLLISADNAMKWLMGEAVCELESYIDGEIDYFISFYNKLIPSMFISYDREAFYANEVENFRLTFDENILCRQTDLSLNSDIYGESIIESDKIIMEIKCFGAIPLWLVRVLSDEKIYKTSFSKYGIAYTKYVFPQLVSHKEKENKNAG